MMVRRGFFLLAAFIAANSATAPALADLEYVDCVVPTNLDVNKYYDEYQKSRPIFGAVYAEKYSHASNIPMHPTRKTTSAMSEPRSTTA